MAAEVPLNQADERFWRALMRVRLPKAPDDDLLRATGLTLSEYSVLMHLSEAADVELRMSQLASATGLSTSRISRVVNTLPSRGWMMKRRHDQNARGNVASLTEEGLRHLELAYPTVLLSARRRVVDHLDLGSITAQRISSKRSLPIWTERSQTRCNPGCPQFTKLQIPFACVRRLSAMT
ncbi:MarR family winged helix-turn-helix transcriptional regulator [Actinacidiphila glaucinigra]|uniref:MarR family winged helix-turn-helix transcriptional regulator n=1 Tax=Actinacidiphila glaucinigra TaxID=235986 RepID=UPI0037CB7CBC